MTLYPIILFCHLAATLVVAAALSIEAISLRGLRRSTTRSELRMWSDLVPRFSLIIIGSLAVLLLSGGYMTEQIAAWTLGWPRIAVLGLVLIAPFGAVTGKRMRAIRRESSKDSATGTDLNTRVRDPFLKISFCVEDSPVFWHRVPYDGAGGLRGVDDCARCEPVAGIRVGVFQHARKHC